MAQLGTPHSVVLITGGSTGIGRAGALELAKTGSKVVIMARNPERLEAAVKHIRSESGNDDVHSIRVDLSRMADVRRAAAEFRQQCGRLDVLVNNAGAYFGSYQETAEGHEMTFALNHLNYFLLTHLLLDLLLEHTPARIVNVASGAEGFGKMRFDNLMFKGRYNSWLAYSQSKRANVLFTYALARRLENTGVTVNTMHPGFVASDFGKGQGWWGVVSRILHLAALTPEQGAETLVYLASSPEVAGKTGGYYQKKQKKESSAESNDQAVQERLWVESEKLVGLTEEEKRALEELARA